MFVLINRRRRRYAQRSIAKEERNTILDDSGPTSKPFVTSIELNRCVRVARCQRLSRQLLYDGHWFEGGSIGILWI